MENKNNSSHDFFRRKGHGSWYFLERVHHRIGELAIHAIWEESYLRWDFSLTNSHYTQPICADSCLHKMGNTKRIEVLVVFISILIHSNKSSFIWISSNIVSVHNHFMSSLISQNEAVCFDWFPKFGSEDLTEECPRPETLY
jgi:hypothetical protein